MVNDTRRWFGTVGVACALVITALTAPARADEVWVAPTAQQDLGGLGIGSNVIWPATAAGVVRLAWAVPDNLQTFQSAKVVLIPHSPGGAANLNIFICPAENSDPVAAGCAGPFAQAFTGVANQLTEVDISAVVAPHVGVPGGNYLAVLAFTTPTTATDHIVGLRFAYAPEVPVGAATLTANTFTGTQTATAFVGDGSGLTNLPFPAGAATLGANTFTGTQTINTGNLDLDPSTATTGNITKNGVPILHDSGSRNIFVGVDAGNLTTTGGQNAVVGVQALTSNTTGSVNVAIGDQALASNTTGFSNTAAGFGTLSGNTTGGVNTAIGNSALAVNTTGGANTAVGSQALDSNTTGSNNVGVGIAAGFLGTTGSNNIYLGALVFGTAGESNTMYLGNVGTQTKTVIAGIRGTAVAGGEPVVIDANGRLGSGPVSPGASTVGTSEVINDSLTSNDLAANSVGTSEVAFNYAASTSEGGPATDLACVACVAASEVNFSFATLGANTFTATQTINTGNLDLDSSTNTTGNITKNGTPFLHNFGLANIFAGVNSGNFIMTGDGNTAIGSAVLFNNTTGIVNSAIGREALGQNTTGDQNTAAGAFALTDNTTGDNNTALGSGALGNNTIGINNIAVGQNAGSAATTGSNNIYLGTQVPGVAGESSTMYLGKVGTQTKTFIAGVRGVTTVNANAIPVMIDSLGQLGTVSSSIRFKEDIHDMADASRRLLNLRPVTFRYAQAYTDGAKPIQYGLIAEEVAEVFPELAVRSADGHVETVHYETLNVLLLNELQNQDRRIQQHVQRIADQNRRIEALEAQQRRIEVLERLLGEVIAERTTK